MQFKIKNDTLIIDEDDHYWVGVINPNDFPEEIRDNYLDIIQKSFDNFIDEEYSVTRNFEDTSRYIINFHYKSKPFSFKRTIEIPMMLKDKDFKDYTNERIEKLEEEIKKLHETFQVLQLSIQQKSELIEDEEEEEEEDDEESSVEVEVPIKTKGGKAVSSTVKLKNGRQTVCKI